MNRPLRVLTTAAVASISMLTASSSAYADTVFDTGMVTVVAATRAMRVDVGGITAVSVDKVSDPGVQLRVTADDGSVPAVPTPHAAGENGCSAADDPEAGTLNRTVAVQGGPSVSLYVKVQYTTTTPLGLSTTHVLEPLGPAGTSVVASGVPVSVCVA